MASVAATDPLLKLLLDALPYVARATGGNALVADRQGRRIHAVDHEGRERPEFRGVMHDLCRRAAQEGRVLADKSSRQPGADVWVLPLGDYVLAASNGQRAARESQLRASLQAALPLIAKVSAGESLIFDREGRCLMSALPDGRWNTERIGYVSESCHRTMARERPDVSESSTVPGAITVRIPITRDFGFGFNNAWRVTGAAAARGIGQVSSGTAEGTARYSWQHIIGDSPVLEAVLQVARRAARSDSPVLIHGETGTGKELLAQAIHNGSGRRRGPFVAINCAGLPPTLVESTLFGYTEGSFTGARRGGQAGLFEHADGGTLLLDEISELDLGLQAKLLRVLQEEEVTRIGAFRPQRVNVRVICTSNRDLRQLTAAGQFRPDLYYRLNVLDIRVPPLRERPEDIPRLVEVFCQQLGLRLGKAIHRVEPEAMERLQAFGWPGNIRELKNCLERAINLADGDMIAAAHLPPYLAAGPANANERSLEERVRTLEREIVAETLAACGGNRALAARRLGISTTTLWRKLRSDDDPHGDPAPVGGGPGSAG